MDQRSIEFLPLGEEAILINFEQRIDPLINDFIHDFTNYLKSKGIEGLQYFIPAYASLTIGFDKEKWNFEDVRERMRRFLDKDFVLISSLSPRTLNIPVCYDRQFGLDLDHLAKTRGLSHSDIIRLHTGREYQVFMLGFLPGFVYLGNSHDSLVFGRRPEPRLRVPASSVGLAGNQTGIYPSEAPGGWQIIGRTPIPIFLPTNDQPFLFNPGDRVRFYDISHSEYLQIRKLEKPWSSLKIDIPTND